jgi:hypothetical protein
MHKCGFWGRFLTNGLVKFEKKGLGGGFFEENGEYGIYMNFCNE